MLQALVMAVQTTSGAFTLDNMSTSRTPCATPWCFSPSSCRCKSPWP
jgi:hypothetical protein